MIDILYRKFSLAAICVLRVEIKFNRWSLFFQGSSFWKISFQEVSGESSLIANTPKFAFWCSPNRCVCTHTRWLEKLQVRLVDALECTETTSYISIYTQKKCCKFRKTFANNLTRRYQVFKHNDCNILSIFPPLACRFGIKSTNMNFNLLSAKRKKNRYLWVCVKIITTNYIDWQSSIIVLKTTNDRYAHVMKFSICMFDYDCESYLFSMRD